MSFSILFPTNEYTTSSKSPEQIQRLTLPPEQTIQQKFNHIITKGSDSQLPYVLIVVNQLYKNFHQAYKSALEFVCEKTPTQQSQNQILIAQSLAIILEQQFESIKNESLQLIFDTCLESLNNLQSPANQYIITVLEMIIKKHVNYKQFLKKMEGRCLELGKQTQPIISRVTSGRIISIMSRYMNRTMKGQMIDILKRILSDNEVEAKKIWITEIFPKLLCNLDLEFFQLHFQEKIYECVWDQNEEIVRLSLAVIFKNITKFSIEEQSSRIVKLFIDSLTSKNEKIAMMATETMGQTYQKLLNVILKIELKCIKFWKTIIELSKSKNQIILNNMIYNLPGILKISAALYKVDPLCDIYMDLYYSPISNKMLLASYYHEMVCLFPAKSNELKQLLYWMLNQLFEEPHPSENAIKIVNKILQNLYQFKHIFLAEVEQEQYGGKKYFENCLGELLLKYLQLLLDMKICKWISGFIATLTECLQFFSPDFIQKSLAPKMYSFLRNNMPNIELSVQLLLKLISRDNNPQLINNYISKINFQLSKSAKRYQREIALLFIYNCSFQFSIEIFSEYKIGEKFLSFYNDKSFKIKSSFLRFLPRIQYFLDRQQKIEYSIILSRLSKDSDPEIMNIFQSLNFSESQQQKNEIYAQSQKLRQRQKQKNLLIISHHMTITRRSVRQLKKQDIIKKKKETAKVKNKITIKEAVKKKLTPILLKTSSNFHIMKNT